MATTTITTFDGTTGKPLDTEEVIVPDAPVIDIAQLANDLTILTEAVDQLIIESLGGSDV